MTQSEWIISLDDDLKDFDELFVGNVRDGERLIRCKECEHFEYDHVEQVDGIPLIVAHEICVAWGNGCKTSENGWCFLAEKKEGEKQ